MSNVLSEGHSNKVWVVSCYTQLLPVINQFDCTINDIQILDIIINVPRCVGVFY